MNGVSGTPVEHWYVTLTVAGEDWSAGDVSDAMYRLLDEQPLLQSCRYGPGSAEVRYWEQAADLQDAAAMALRLWSEHRRSARLPDWRVVGLEVVDRTTFHRRRNDGPLQVVGSSMAEVHPF